MGIKHKCIKLINNIKFMVKLYRQQNYNAASKLNQTVIEDLTVLITFLDYYKYDSNEDIVNNNYKSKIMFRSISNTFGSGFPILLQAQELHDYVLLADQYECIIIPNLINIIDILISYTFNDPSDAYLTTNCGTCLGSNAILSQTLILFRSHPSFTNVFDNYAIEDTTTGDYTLSVTLNGSPHYLHSNSDPVEEARILASEYYNLEIDHYIVLGFGLGYHIQALQALDPTITIDIYETDLNVLGFAFSYMDLTALLSDPNITLHYDPDCTNLLTNITQPSTRLFIHYPSLQNIRNPKVAALLQEYFIQESSIRNRGPLLYQNYRKNRQKAIPNIDTIRDVFAKKDLYMIAAGPSLDNNVTLLRNHPENSIILAVGTVFHKLLKSNIRPDYILISDPDPIVYRQIEGLENEQIPLILLSTAHYSLADRYQGPQYRVYQQDFGPAMADAQKNNHMLFNTGGSVSTLALDLGIRLHSRRIIFLGLDLAYTNNVSHATETATSTAANPNEMQVIPAANGGEVSSTGPLIIYKKWMERRLLEDDCQTIPIIDATEGGARIEGMQILSLAEALSMKEDTFTFNI